MIRFLLPYAMVLTMAACVSVPTNAELEQAPKVYSGRFAISYQKEGQTHREQGGFEWKIQNTTSQSKAMQLSLLSPLGPTMGLIAFDPKADTEQRASFTSPNHTAYASDLDTLMQTLLGWRLPLTMLSPWLEKNPPPPQNDTAPSQAPDDWQISVLSRHPNGLPKLISLIHTQLQLNARLVFEE